MAAADHATSAKLFVTIPLPGRGRLSPIPAGARLGAAGCAKSNPAELDPTQPSWSGPADRAKAFRHDPTQTTLVGGRLGAKDQAKAFATIQPNYGATVFESRSWPRQGRGSSARANPLAARPSPDRRLSSGAGRVGVHWVGPCAAHAVSRAFTSARSGDERVAPHTAGRADSDMQGNSCPLSALCVRCGGVVCTMRTLRRTLSQGGSV